VRAFHLVPVGETITVRVLATRVRARALELEAVLQPIAVGVGPPRVRVPALDLRAVAEPIAVAIGDPGRGGRRERHHRGDRYGEHPERMWPCGIGEARDSAHVFPLVAMEL
jgi:hypothetical protein